MILGKKSILESGLVLLVFLINLLYSSGNNNNILVSNSFIQNGSPIKKNIEKEFNSNSNSTASFAQNTPNKKIEPIFESDRNSYKYLKKRDSDSSSIKHF